MSDQLMDSTGGLQTRYRNISEMIQQKSKGSEYFLNALHLSFLSHLLLGKHHQFSFISLICCPHFWDFYCCFCQLQLLQLQRVGEVEADEGWQTT